jgi:hypothetical protein
LILKLDHTSPDFYSDCRFDVYIIKHLFIINIFKTAQLIVQFINEDDHPKNIDAYLLGATNKKRRLAEGLRTPTTGPACRLSLVRIGHIFTTRVGSALGRLNNLRQN